MGEQRPSKEAELPRLQAENQDLKRQLQELEKQLKEIEKKSQCPLCETPKHRLISCQRCGARVCSMHLTLFERTASNGASRHQEWLCRDCNPDIQELERDRANKELVRYGQFRRPQPPPHD